jgi:hypothetical protein
MMMETETVSETLGFCPQLTQFVSREDFIEFSRHETFQVIAKYLFINFLKLTNKQTNSG